MGNFIGSRQHQKPTRRNKKCIFYALFHDPWQVYLSSNGDTVININCRQQRCSLGLYFTPYEKFRSKPFRVKKTWGQVISLCGN